MRMFTVLSVSLVAAAAVLLGERLARCEEQSQNDDVAEIMRKYGLSQESGAASAPQADLSENTEEEAAEPAPAPPHHHHHRHSDRAPAAVTKFAPPAKAPETEKPAPDKSHYSLFNPTPRDQMRDFDSDRPGATDSPRTVDAGHFMFESEAFAYAQHKTTSTDAASGSVTKTNQKTYTLNNVMIGAGLTDSLELQGGFTSYIHQNTATDVDGAPSTSSASGFGNTTARLKWNLIGNGGGPLAIGLIPAIRFPSNTGGVASSRAEQSLGVPMAFSLPSDWSLNIMPQWNRNKNDSNDSMHSEFFTAITLGHTIVGPLDGYVQVYNTSSDESDSSMATSTGFGFAYHVAPNVQLDAGSNFGLTKAADDVNFSMGIAIRY